MESVELKQKIRRTMAQVLGVVPEAIGDDASPDTLASWDSLAHMNLVIALEQAFHVEFSEEQIVTMLNFKLIVVTLEEILSASPTT